MRPNFVRKVMWQKILKSLGYEMRRTEELYLGSLRQFDYGKVFNRVLYFYERYTAIEDREGDIVECGIGYSRTFQILACLLKWENNPHRKLYGFDSFEGFPEPHPEDRSARNPKKGEWKVLTPNQLFRILELLRLDKEFIENQVRIEKGFFEDTLSLTTIEKIALLHLDVDLYQSYKMCLEQLFPKVVKGGVVLFDEYDSPNWPGAKKAIDECFKHTSYRPQKDMKSGKYFLFKT